MVTLMGVGLSEGMRRLYEGLVILFLHWDDGHMGMSTLCKFNIEHLCYLHFYIILYFNKRFIKKSLSCIY